METRSHISQTLTLQSVLPAISLRDQLEQRTSVGQLYEPVAGGMLKCTACAHRCVMPEGARGSCGVRRNAGGVMRVPFGYVTRKYVRPVETNTIFHV
ncbi:MAG TPA: hypothetical protein VGP93_08510, partial [Polyangiaceae bacterium]|nr:hypothetical protein [Polyangiaceae bacterium]